MQRDFSSSLTSTEEVKEKVSEAVQGMKPRGRQVHAPSSCVPLHVLLPPSPCVCAPSAYAGGCSQPTAYSSEGPGEIYHIFAR